MKRKSAPKDELPDIRLLQVRWRTYEELVRARGWVVRTVLRGATPNLSAKRLRDAAAALAFEALEGVEM